MNRVCRSKKAEDSIHNRDLTKMTDRFYRKCRKEAAQSSRHMNCYYCGAHLDSMGTCPSCETHVRVWKKIVSISNKLYNDGLERAQARDLTGTLGYTSFGVFVILPSTVQARNLLGLVQGGEIVKARSRVDHQ
ncbi:MAG: hypothetical protein V8R46_08445 [Eubacterium ramulus]